LGKPRNSNDLTQRQGNVSSRFGSVLSSTTIVINPSQLFTTSFSSSAISLTTDAGNTLVRPSHSSTCTCWRWCMLRIAWGSSFHTLSRFGSFHKTNFFRGKVINVSCVVHLTSNMALTELQFWTCNVSKLVKKGSKLSARSTPDKNWQFSTFNLPNLLKDKSGIYSDPCNISCSPDQLLRLSSSSSEICANKTILSSTMNRI